MRIDDNEGALLTRYGLGTEYDIKGKLNVGETLQIQVSVPTIEKAIAQTK